LQLLLSSLFARPTVLVKVSILHGDKVIAAIGVAVRGWPSPHHRVAHRLRILSLVSRLQGSALVDVSGWM
jgi:hypothetical protein